MTDEEYVRLMGVVPGSSMNPFPDCGVDHPADAELWWCQACSGFHDVAGRGAAGGTT